MRYEILQQIKEHLERTLKTNIMTYEPNWQLPNTFPVIWLSFGEEQLKEGLNASQRSIPVTIYVAHRGTAQSVLDVEREILDISDRVESILTNYAFAVEEKKATLEYSGFRWFQDRISEQGSIYVVLATEISFNVKIRR